MPFFLDHMHYAQIAAVLRAADVEARVVSQGDTPIGVEVHLEDGSRIIWGNTKAHWAYTLVRDDPDSETFYVDTLMTQGALPEVVAGVIATWPYASKPVSVLAD